MREMKSQITTQIPQQDLEEQIWKLKKKKITKPDEVENGMWKYATKEQSN